MKSDITGNSPEGPRGRDRDTRPEGCETRGPHKYMHKRDKTDTRDKLRKVVETSRIGCPICTFLRNARPTVESGARSARATVRCVRFVRNGASARLEAIVLMSVSSLSTKRATYYRESRIGSSDASGVSVSPDR